MKVTETDRERKEIESGGKKGSALVNSISIDSICGAFAVIWLSQEIQIRNEWIGPAIHDI